MHASGHKLLAESTKVSFINPRTLGLKIEKKFENYDVQSKLEVRVNGLASSSIIFLKKKYFSVLFYFIENFLHYINISKLRKSQVL